MSLCQSLGYWHVNVKGGAEENRELKDAEPETLKCDSYRRGMLQRPHCCVEQSEHRYLSALLPTLLSVTIHIAYTRSNPRSPNALNNTLHLPQA